MLRCNARSVIFNAKFGTVRHSLPAYGDMRAFRRMIHGVIDQFEIALRS